MFPIPSQQNTLRHGVRKLNWAQLDALPNVAQAGRQTARLGVPSALLHVRSRVENTPSLARVTSLGLPTARCFDRNFLFRRQICSSGEVVTCGGSTQCRPKPVFRGLDWQVPVNLAAVQQEAKARCCSEAMKCKGAFATGSLARGGIRHQLEIVGLDHWRRDSSANQRRAPTREGNAFAHAGGDN